MSETTVSSLNKVFYNIRPLLERKADLYIVLGGRGIGKTHSTLHYCLEQYIQTQKKFVWVRKYSGTEISEFSKKFRETYYEEIGPINFISTRGEIVSTNNKEIIGYLIPLTEAYSKRGNTDIYNEVETLVFDEFTTSSTKNFTKEEWIFLDLVSSICRHRENIKVIMLANMTEKESNEFLSTWNINIPYKNGIYESIKNGCKIVIQRVKHSQKLLDVYKKSISYKITSLNPKYWTYAFENDLTLINSYLLTPYEVKLKKAVYTIVTENRCYGMWEAVYSHRKIYYLREEKLPPTQNIYLFDDKDVLYTQKRSALAKPLTKLWFSMLSNKEIYFSSTHILNKTVEYIVKNCRKK